MICNAHVYNYHFRLLIGASNYICRKGELHFIILNYIPDFTLHHKLFKCTFYILNYDHCYTLHLDVKFAVNLDKKVWHHVKRLNCLSSQFLKSKEEITFIYHPKLYFWLHLHHKFWISIQVNGKLNVGMQNVTRVIVYDAKCAFKKYKM